VLAWVGWCVMFRTLVDHRSPIELNRSLYKSLIKGSLAELFVAIPSHLVARQRTECCAGMYSGFGIVIGLIVMLIAMGPAVYYLFQYRYRDTYARRDRAQRELE
jgi:hypothetical protein